MSSRTARALHCCLLLFLTTLAQAARLQHFDVEDGLPQNSATALAVDRFGLLWVGTEDGLARFDGSRFVAFADALENGWISGNYVIALASDPDFVWIAAESGGLARFDLLRERFEILALRSPDDGGALNVGSLLIIGDRLWLGTRDQGLFEVDRRQPTRILRHWRAQGQSNPQLPIRTVRGLVLDDSGRGLWVTGDGGLVHLDLASGAISAQPIVALDPSSAETDATVALSDGSGGMWLATRSHGLFRRTAAGQPFVAVALAAALQRAGSGELSVNSISRAADGGILVASDRGLLSYAPECACLARPEGIAAFGHDAVGALFLTLLNDGEFVWAGSWNRGLFRIDARAPAFDLLTPFQIGSEAAPAAARSLFVDAGNRLWIGTFGQGVRYAPIGDGVMADWNWQRLSLSADPRGRQVWTTADAPGGILIGSDNDLVHWRHAGRQLRHLDLDPQRADQLRVMIPASDGKLWAGAVGSLHRIDLQTLQSRRFADADGLADGRVYALAEWPRGQLLIGTWSGLYRMPLAGDHIEPWPLRRHGREQASGLIWDLHVDATGELWIGSSVGLLHAVAGSDGEVERISTAEGLPNNVIYAIEADADGQLWLSSNRGIARYDRERRTVVAYDARDGLQGNEFGVGLSARDGAGRLYFGGLGGVSRIDPAQLQPDERTPQALISQLRIGNRGIGVGELRHGHVVLERSLLATERIALSYRDSDLGFAVSALGTDHADHLRFQYRLDGKDREWIDSDTRRYIAYTNLAPAEYVFRVRAAGRFGRFGAERRLAIGITPPLWATWSFRAAAALVIVLLAAAMVRWRFAALNRSRAELAAEVARQTERIREQNEQLEAANQALFDRSIRDPLTGAFNRRHFSELAEQAYLACRSRGRAFALVLLDVDHFKQVNDLHGHAAGDAVLCAIVHSLQPQLHGLEALGRFGGEEFLIMLPAHAADAAVARAQALRRLLQDLRIASGEAVLQVTASFGIAATTPDHQPPLEALLVEADAALYRAKAGGRNRVELASCADAGAPAYTSGDHAR